MSRISLEKYGPIISDKQIGEEISGVIEKELLISTEIEIDLQGIKSMATFCAKQIFGKLYLSMGSGEFFNRIKLLNATDDIKLLIRIGIQNAIEDGIAQ